jgi:serine protease inhibitor
VRLTAGEPTGALAQAVVRGDTALALRMYARLAGSDGNIVFSPYSISAALSMAMAGARGATADELAATLGAGADGAAWHGGRNDVDQWLTRPAPEGLPAGVEFMSLQPANALFGQDGVAFKQPFLDLLARDYGSGLQLLDFAADPEAGRGAINGWVADRTSDKIRNLLAPGTITDATRFVIVNAILFRASWSQPIEPSRTAPAPFHRLDGPTVQAPLMHATIQASYSRGDDWSAVDLGYLGATMTVLVPDTGRYAAVERALNPELLNTIEAKRQFALVHLSLPRWSSTTSADLVDHLKALGIHDLFDSERADLQGIADLPLSVSQVIHQATISVDEHGTEAAAATAIVGDTTGGGPDTEATLRIDRPFIYVIRDDGTGEILFAGRVLDPTAG